MSTEMISGRTQPTDECFADRLQEEHEALASQLARLETMANGIAGEGLPLETLRSELDCACDLLAGKVLPHLRTADAFRSELVKRDYVRAETHPDHDEAEKLTSELGALRARVNSGETKDAPHEIRRILYELHALTRLHFAGDCQENR